MQAVERALRRDRLLTLLALAVLTVLAWIWLAQGAGMDMAPRATLDPFPHRAGGAMAEMPGMADMPGMTAAPEPWTPARLALAFSMWWVMMVAMMLPAATPLILLHARSARQASGGAPTGPFVGGYLAIWALFSLIATAAHALLDQAGVLAPMTMGSVARWFSATVLIAAGLYQVSPLKGACLAHCRNPAQFLSRHYRPGRGGAFRMGVRHGAFCVGCCWLLMALLFVGGVMNLAWIAALTLLVAAEKLLPGGRYVAYAAGVGFIAWGALTLAA